MPDRLFCYIRKRWIKASPEEKIRQSLINYLKENLDYPLNQMIIEKGLECLPHLDPTLTPHFPIRRIDLLILAKDLHPHHPFYPLILIECKATHINEKAMRQVLGYNHFLKSCFIALANQHEVQLGWIEPGQNLLISKKGIPSYPLLLEHAKKLINLL